jgi:hypothetical protein
MRTRWNFQPTLDLLPARIAPSALGVLSQVVVPYPMSSPLPVQLANLPACACSTPPGSGGTIVVSPPSGPPDPGLC